MIIIRNLNQIKNQPSPLALTIGNFDGVHLGHLKNINEVKKIAKEKNISSAILTFEPHPISFFQSKNNFRLTSLAQKLKIFQNEKIDFVIILPFNQNLSEISADDFINKILIKHLNIKHLTIGYDFIFGKNRQGNFKLLEENSKRFNFGLNKVAAIKKDGHICSSSSIRALVSKGEIVFANQILGKNFTISGLVNQGRKLASQIGFPTLNIKPKPHIIKPKFGVYKTISFIPHLNQKFISITNFGIKPTITNSAEPLFETYIPNFNQNIYGKKISVEFTDFIREEKKFNSLNELQDQIKKDIKKLNL